MRSGPDGAQGSGRLRPPALGLLLAEARGLFEFNASLLLSPVLMRAPRGDGHPVLTLPGFLASDLSMAPIRRYLTELGYDTHVGKLPEAGGLLIFCASYNGAAPDNATQFVKWLDSGLSKDALAKVRYAVFGCGNSDWAATYQSVPRLIDEQLAAHVGGIRMVVSLDVRGQGVGRALSQETFALALGSGLERLTVQMTVDQQAAIALFESLGFKAEALLRDHVRDVDGKKHEPDPALPLLLRSLCARDDPRLQGGILPSAPGF